MPSSRSSGLRASSSTLVRNFVRLFIGGKVVSLFIMCKSRVWFQTPLYVSESCDNVSW